MGQAFVGHRGLLRLLQPGWAVREFSLLGPPRPNFIRAAVAEAGGVRSPILAVPESEPPWAAVRRGEIRAKVEEDCIKLTLSHLLGTRKRAAEVLGEQRPDRLACQDSASKTCTFP